MRTYLYLVCMDHNPPLTADGESGQHLYDLPKIRADIANRDTLVAANQTDDGFFDRGHHFANNTLRFLIAHPHCQLGIRDEYGRWYSITDEDTPQCGASITLSRPHHQVVGLVRCARPDRHPGHHDDGDGVTWTGR